MTRSTTIEVLLIPENPSLVVYPTLRLGTWIYVGMPVVKRCFATGFSRHVHRRNGGAIEAINIYMCSMYNMIVLEVNCNMYLM